MADTVINIDPRFCGPPQSGNGGYVCGLIAKHCGTRFGHTVQMPDKPCWEVRLVSPPPLDTPLSLHCNNGEHEQASPTNSRSGTASLQHGATVIATARVGEVTIDVPAAVTLDQARAAETHYAGHRSHTFPNCFVCGPQRQAHDGLRIFAGRVQGDQESGGASREERRQEREHEIGGKSKIEPGVVASRWLVDASLGSNAGVLDEEFIWAALDCPGFFAVREQAGIAVLGSLCAVINGPVHIGDELVVIGWPIASVGRKHQAGTALFKGDTLLASASATWISVSAEGFSRR